MSRTIGPRTVTHAITGETKAPPPQEPAVLRSRAVQLARLHGWKVEDGSRDVLLTDLQETWFMRDDTRIVVAKFDKRGRCFSTNACEPSRLLLLLAGSCSCEGEPRSGAFDHWSEYVTPGCPVHEEAW